MKKVIYRFADDIKINNRHFNDGISPETLDLKTDYKVLPKKIEVPHRGRLISKVTYIAVVFWKVAVTGAENVFDEEEDVANVLNAFGHLDIEGANTIEEEEDDQM